MRAGAGVPVLMYHSVATRATPGFRRFVVRPSEFAAQMDYLRERGFCPVTAAELARGRLDGGPLPGRPVVLTFDDAFTDFATAVMPVLRQHGFRATLYVPTAYVGTTARWLRGCGEHGRSVLSWQALRDIAAEGIEVAAHSHTHPQLDRVPEAVARDEIHRPKHVMEENLGLAVDGFAYPFGYWNRAARTQVAGTGYRYACAVSELMTSPADDVFTLPRLTVNAGIGITGLARLLRTRPTPARRRSAGGKRILWRALRQGIPALGGDPREGSTA